MANALAAAAKSLQLSCSVVSNSFQPHGLQHARLPCPWPTPGDNSNSCPSSRWCHLTISYSDTHFSCPQSFWASGSFQWVSYSNQVAKYWSFSFSISPSNKYSGLISFRIDWFDFLAVQGTLKSLLQHHSSKASFLWHSAFFLVQLSHPYMTTGKSIALTIWTFVDKVMSLLFNKPSRLDIAFLQGATSILQFHDCSHHLQWFGAPRNKVSHFSMWETSLRSWSYGL